MRSSKNFTFDDLLNNEDLRLDTEVATIDAAFDQLIPKDSHGFIKSPSLIGIDGSVTAGKSFTSESLMRYISSRGADCVLIHGDWFMPPRAQRRLEVEKAIHGSYNIADYDAVACDFDKLAQIQCQISLFLQSGADEQGISITDAYNRATGECDQTIHLTLHKSSVIIFEGSGVLNRAMCDAFDLSIRVDIDSYEKALERLNERELKKSRSKRLDTSFVKERYDLIDHPYDQYLRYRDRKNFDFLLDTSNVALLKIYKRS